MTKTKFDWNDGAYVPDNPCYCLCEVKGIPHTKYMTLKWDRENWLMWNYFDKRALGWFGFFSYGKVVRWCLIEEKK